MGKPPENRQSVNNHIRHLINKITQNTEPLVFLEPRTERVLNVSYAVFTELLLASSMKEKAPVVANLRGASCLSRCLSIRPARVGNDSNQPQLRHRPPNSSHVEIKYD